MGIFDHRRELVGELGLLLLLMTGEGREGEGREGRKTVTYLHGQHDKQNLNLIQ